MLASIPSDILAKAAAMLPDAESAPDEPQYVKCGTPATGSGLSSDGSSTRAAKRRAGIGLPRALRRLPAD